MIDPRRSRVLNGHAVGTGPIVYWMGRDQRVADNWALLAAADTAAQLQRPLAVLFVLPPALLGISWRHYAFALQGLRVVAAELAYRNIAFYLIQGNPELVIPRFCDEHSVGALYADFTPLRAPMTWKHKLAHSLKIPLYEVDTHNIVPAWLVTPKQEYAAATFRPKLNRLLPEFLTDFPPLPTITMPWKHTIPPINWEKLEQEIVCNREVWPVTWCKPGEVVAKAALVDFVENRLAGYAAKHNDPNANAQSELSPYLHFGHLAPQRAALAVQAASAPEADKEAFLDELIVQRELADNFTFYNPDYDSIQAAPAWALESLHKHVADPRDHVYTYAQFERAETHDELWNAAQRELVVRGKMHGYLRMYWAKMILAWSISPEEAVDTAIRLNDTYSLDGTDPNGYAGVLWSVCGLHDRPWFERPVFGKVRLMARSGCAKKFNIETYIKRIAAL